MEIRLERKGQSQRDKIAGVRPVAATYEPLMNEKQAAQFLGGLHPKTVQRMARRGELPHCRVGKYYRFRASELDARIQVHSRGQISPPAQTRKEIQ